MTAMENVRLRWRPGDYQRDDPDAREDSEPEVPWDDDSEELSDPCWDEDSEELSDPC